jgi:hypothetical protein
VLIVQQHFVSKFHKFREHYSPRDNISYTWHRMKGFPSVDCNQILVRPPASSRRSRIHIWSGSMPNRELSNARRKQPPKIDNTFICHPWMTIQTNVRPFFFFFFYDLLSFHFACSGWHKMRLEMHDKIRCNAIFRITQTWINADV